MLIFKGLVSSVLCLNVYLADRALEDTDLGTCTAGLDNAGLILDAYDLTDDAADGGDLVANGEIISHVSGFLFLLLLGTDAEEIECNDHASEENKGNNGAADISAAEKTKCCYVHVFNSFRKCFKNSIQYILQGKEPFVNSLFVNFFLTR